MSSNISFNKYIYDAIIKNWDADALTDYQGQTLQFHDVARKIEKLHIVFENCGIEKGDKIAICGRNSAHWAVTFLATLTYGAVVVPILHEFNAEQIHNIVNHSGAKALFVGDFVAKEIDPEQMPALEGIVFLPDFSLMVSRSEKLTYAREHLNMMFGEKYPKAFRKEHVRYHEDSPEELALINYTSGTTGFSKGVMIPYRAIMGNLTFCLRHLGAVVKAGDPMLDILPMAHMYGLAIEFVFGFCNGCHLFFLNRLPSPTLIAQAFTEVRPTPDYREDYPQEGVPHHTDQQDETADGHAYRIHEGEEPHLSAGVRGLRRPRLRDHRGWCAPVERGGAVPDEHQLPHHRGLWSHGVCPADQLSRP